jgi:ParB family transcriptional regulator, chromosome partitioning protein
MARKNLLMGLTGSELPAGNLAGQGAFTDPPALPHPRHLSVMGTRGAIGAVARSIEQVKAHSVVDLEPDLIEASFVSDRLKGSEEHHRALVDSIREHGQQVPVLVRPHPEKEGRYQIAYGRRRLLAVAELGRPIRAIVKPLTDEQLVVAQGQENSARKDLSFIEKALFAARLEEAGYSRETIMAALSVDKTGLSRLISSAVKIPQDIIEAIGPAPAAGRDRWIDLAARLERPAALAKAREIVRAVSFGTLDSDLRFNRVFAVAAQKIVKAPRPTLWKADDGVKVARIKDDAKMLALMIDKKTAGDFAAYLVRSLPEIYAAFKHGAQRASQPEPGKD